MQRTRARSRAAAAALRVARRLHLLAHSPRWRFGLVPVRPRWRRFACRQLILARPAAPQLTEVSAYAVTLAIAHTALFALSNADPNRCERAYVGNTIGQVRLALQPLTPSPTQQPTGVPSTHHRATCATAPARTCARRTPSPTSCSTCGVCVVSLTRALTPRSLRSRRHAPDAGTAFTTARTCRARR